MVKKILGANDKGKIKVRFFELEVEGGSEALQDSVRTLAAALQKPTVNPARLISVNSNNHPAPELDLPDDVEDDDDSPSTFVEIPNRPIRQRAKRTPPTPKVLNDLGFADVTPTWAEFAKTKAPDTDVLKVTVAAVWFKRFKNLDSIGIDHVYTAFKFVDWPTPDDIGQAFRNAKRQKNWFSTDGDGNWSVNIVGINAVDKLKPGEGK